MQLPLSGARSSPTEVSGMSTLPSTVRGAGAAGAAAGLMTGLKVIFDRRDANAWLFRKSSSAG